MIMKAEDYGYVIKNNLCLFQKGPLSQWWGGFHGQESTFKVSINDLFDWYIEGNEGNDKILCKIADEYKHLYFNCCEQWMMACKAIIFNDVETFKRIMDEKFPSKQKNLGRVISNYNQELWDEYKYPIVLSGNVYKFEQNEELNKFLKSFNRFTIFAEAAPWDKVWGIGLGPEDPKSLDINTWEGENLLGLVTMKVRGIID